MDANGVTPPRILLADDQLSVLKALRLLLKGEGYEIETAASAALVLEAIGRLDFDVVLMDLNYVRGNTSGQEGLDLLSKIQQIDSTLPVVVMTAWGSVELAVEAMRRGARDFVTKPWKNERLLAVLRTQVELGRALRKGRQLEQENILLRGESRPFMIAESRAMQPVLEAIARVGPSQANVLITGENGAGKGIVAQVLHAASTAQGQAPGQRQHGEHPGDALRERAVRARGRGVHGRQVGPARPLQAGRRRDALSR